MKLSRKWRVQRRRRYEVLHALLTIYDAKGVAVRAPQALAHVLERAPDPPDGDPEEWAKWEHDASLDAIACLARGDSQIGWARRIAPLMGVSVWQIRRILLQARNGDRYRTSPTAPNLPRESEAYS